MKKMLSAVSFILALVIFTGCQSNPKPSETKAESITPSDTVEQTTQKVPVKPSEENREAFLKEAKEVSQILLKYSFPTDKVTEPGVLIDKAYFPRIANYMVYDYMCAVFSHTIKGRSELYSQYISYSPEDQKAVVTRNDMSLIVYRLFGINTIPATLISSEEFIDEKNQFEFSSKEPKEIGAEFDEIKVSYDEDDNIIVTFKIKDSNKAHGFYRIVFCIMEDDGEEYLRFQKFYQL